MSKLYRSREGDITAADTKTQLTTLGSETAPGPLLVPASAKMIAAVIVAFGPDYAAANDAAILLRLEGPGLPEGPEVLAVGAAGNSVATGGNVNSRATEIPLEIPVTVGNEILLFAEMAGEDIGTVTVGATLVFA